MSFSHWIDGKRCNPSGDKQYPVYNSATGIIKMLYRDSGHDNVVN